MKIVHLCFSCPYIDNFSYQENILPKYHLRMGYDVTVIASLVSFDENGKRCLLDKESNYLDKNGFKVIRVDYKGKFIKRINKYLRRYTSVYEQLNNENPDIIFMHGIAFCDVVKVKKYLNENPHVKLYADSHADTINSGRNILSKYILHSIIWRTCAKIIEPYLVKCFGVTPNRCNYLHNMFRIPNEKIELLIMGVDDESIPVNRMQVKQDIRLKLGLADDDFVIITGGKIDKSKNIHILINTIKDIDLYNLHLIVFGNILPDFKELIELSLDFDRIHYIGWREASEITNYMIASDLACFPGTHSVLWEQSIGLALPAIFKKWEGMTHVDVNGNCIFIKGDDAEELKQVILSIMNPEVYRVILGKSIEASNKFKYSDISKRAIGK